MPRCKCSEECNCTVTETDDCLNLTGLGIGSDPFVLGTIIDPDVTNELTCEPDGLLLPRDDHLLDTDCIDLEYVGDRGGPGQRSTITANFIISPDSCNVLECRPPAANNQAEAQGLYALPGPQEWCWCMVPDPNQPNTPLGNIVDLAGDAFIDLVDPGNLPGNNEVGGFEFTIPEPGCYRLIWKGRIDLAWAPDQTGNFGVFVTPEIDVVSPFDNCLFQVLTPNQYVYQQVTCGTHGFATAFRTGGVAGPDETEGVPFMASFDYTLTDALAPATFRARLRVLRSAIGGGISDVRVTGGTGKVILGNPPVEQLDDNLCSTCYGYTKTGTYYYVTKTTTTSTTTTTTTPGVGLFLNMGEGGLNPGWVHRCDPGSGIVVTPRRYNWADAKFDGEAMTADPIAGILYHIGGKGAALKTVDPGTLVTGSVGTSGAPFANPLGMAWDGTDVWLADNGGGGGASDLFSITTLGVATLIGTMADLFPGIEWAGGTLYAVNRDCTTIDTINPATGGSLTSTAITFASGPQTPNRCHGLAYDGVDLYVSYALPEEPGQFGNFRRRLGKITTGGVITDIGQFRTAANPGGWQVSDLAFI